MSKRHSSNTNLTVISDGQYQGLTVYAKPLSAQYLDASLRTIHAALNEHPRTLMVRFDLHLPQLNFDDSPMWYDSGVIGKFFKSLNVKIQNDRDIKAREGKRVHPCSMRYVWARERADAATDHYHVAIFLNNDAYNHLGHYNYDGRNLSTKIVEAWASALGLDDFECRHLVHFPESKPMHYINKNALDYPQIFAQAFYRLSYLAKLATKHYGDRARSFSRSQC
ncbi:inovirus Gp2 family protein [Shewanella sp. Isolate11]|uniref:inovirus Gp2 family protein n=1 Tax=Shewanella sp. Isolate11 TaxID=2908530 RepID=UPI001EFD28B0|nr:inovirus Gp2 family protein [Shewanella sp. Isolate11]MCG9698026.1 inovirus Gp2 family protein [Shewanella sp. Isolate11]